jgi:lipopolysaccharide export LptBFGC system permease protein LptF
MKLREKISFGILLTLIVLVAGAIACTYSTTNMVNPILAVVLGTLIFVAAGETACTYSASRIAKRKANQIAP